MSNETLILKSAVATNSNIAITDLPFANVDAVEGAKHFQSASFEGVKTFKSMKTGATAFGTATVKGDEVPIVIGSSEIYDEQFKYGVYVDGQIKTADEIFAPDQEGNYDISDYTTIPATTLLERIETFPAGSNNTIRINKDTAAKYVEGFRVVTNDVGWLPKSQNGKYQYYTTGSFAVGDTLTETLTESAGFKGGKIELFPGETIIINGRGGTAPRQYCIVIGGIVNAMAKPESYEIFTYTATQPCTVYFAINTGVSNEVSAILIKKLDYVVAQANAKGYDITIANNESDIKLIEKVEFDGTKYIDTEVDINGARASEITAEVDIIITNFDNSMGLLSATTIDSVNSACLFLTKANEGNYYLISSGKAIKRTYSPQITVQDMLNKRNLYGLKNLLLTFNGNDDSNTFPNYTIEADNSTKIGCRHVVYNNRNALYGNIFSVTLNDNLFVPAYNNSINGMINLKDMSFHPLIEFS